MGYCAEVVHGAQGSEGGVMDWFAEPITRGDLYWAMVMMSIMAYCTGARIARAIEMAAVGSIGLKHLMRIGEGK